MITDTDVANMALNAVGSRAVISGFNDGTKEANAVALHYQACKGSLLRMVHWAFARRQVALTLMADATAGQSVPTPWTYKYAYPADCKRVRYLVPMYQSVQPSTMVPGTPVTPIYRGPAVKWILNQDVDALNNKVLTILTNQIQALAVYTADSPPYLWDDLFSDAMIGALAARICIPVSGDKKLMQIAVEEGRKALLDARVADANEGIQQQESMPDWMRVRGYLSDYAYPDLYLWSEDPGTMSSIT